MKLVKLTLTLITMLYFSSCAMNPDGHVGNWSMSKATMKFNDGTKVTCMAPGAIKLELNSDETFSMEYNKVSYRCTDGVETRTLMAEHDEKISGTYLRIGKTLNLSVVNCDRGDCSTSPGGLYLMNFKIRSGKLHILSDNSDGKVDREFVRFGSTTTSKNQ